MSWECMMYIYCIPLLGKVVQWTHETNGDENIVKKIVIVSDALLVGEVIYFIQKEGHVKTK